MKIRYAAVEEKKEKRQTQRFYCDAGKHWVTGLGTKPVPAVVAKKDGFTVRDCGREHQIEKPKQEKIERPWCQYKIVTKGVVRQCIRKTDEGDAVFCKQHRKAVINEQVKKDLKKSLETPFYTKKQADKIKKASRISSTNKIIKSLVKKNPYRPGAQRTLAFELLIKAGRKGVPYAEFVNAKGLVSDGMKKGFLKVEVLN